MILFSSVVFKSLLVRVSEASKLAGFIAHDLSGLFWSPMEETDDTDGDATGDPEDAI